MTPGTWSPTIYRGATFKRTIQLREDDGETHYPMDGKDGHYIIRTFVGGEVLLDLLISDADARFTIDAADDAFLIELPDEFTATLPIGKVIHSLDLIEGDEVLPVLEGKITVKGRAVA